MIRRPRRITTQLLVLLVVSVVAFQLSVFTLEEFHPVEVRLPYQAQQIVFIVDALGLMEPANRPAYLAKVNAAEPENVIRLLPPSAPVPSAPMDEQLRLQLLPHMAKGTAIVGTDDGGMQIRTPNGIVVEFDPTHFMPKAPHGGIVISTFFAMIACGVLFLLYALRSIRRPLRAFAVALDRFGIDQAIQTVPEKGPTEINTVARVLNSMQTRIKTMMEDRTRTLAALGHDLRTPITRLRLRAQAIPDERLRLAMIRDLEYMQRMAHAALSYLRDDTPVPKAPIDLASLLQTICDDAGELGEPVTYDGPEHLVIPGRIDDLRRAVSNLVGNAVFQEASVTVTLRDIPGEGVEIEVIDDGPGIADSDKETVFEPFRRLERSATDRKGFGLGLSIVRNVARAHGGDVTLHDRAGGGLICRIRLPTFEEPRQDTSGTSIIAPPAPVPALPMQATSGER